MARHLMAAVLALLVATSLNAGAQTADRQPKIGFLSWHAIGPNQELFRQALRDTGYVDGQNITVEWRWADGDERQAVAFATELARLAVDVLVVHSTPAVGPAMSATNTIPIVVLAADPVGTGAAASYSRPGGNVTGASLNSVELAGKRLELLREMLPGIRRVAYLASSIDPNGARFVEQTQAAALRLGIDLAPEFIRGAGDIEGAIAAALRKRAGAMIVQPLFTEHSPRIAELTARHRLPAVSDFPRFVHAGGLMAYGASPSDWFRQAAGHVDKILKGARPSELPVLQPTRFELAINMKTAQSLGINVPRSLLLRADYIVR